jgi:hypothetical protein
VGGPSSAQLIFLYACNMVRMAMHVSNCVPMNSKGGEYRQMATEAEKQAEATVDHNAKLTYRDIAKQWREMADQAERLQRLDQHAVPALTKRT